MTPRWRRVVAALGLLGFAVLFASAFHDLAPSGAPLGAYANAVNASTVVERRATDAVAAVTFDYRGFDTLGEELILFLSVMGVGVVFREQHDPDDPKERRERVAPEQSDAVRVLALALVGTMVCFGIYVCTHGQTSPGGGFQGGVVLATAPIVVFLAADARTFARIAPESYIKACESLGAAGYVLLGVAGLAWAGAYLANILPLGSAGDVFSSGTIAALNAFVGIEVAAGFVSLLLSYVGEAVAREIKEDE